MRTPDEYGGSAVTTQNIIRKVGKSTTQDIAGAATFTSDPYQEWEIMFGIDSDDDDAEPYGPKGVFKVACAETPEIEVSVVDDALATDLTALAFDPDDGNQITAADDFDMDAGQIKTVTARWTGSFEEDFGNRWCEDDEGVKNVLVVRYNNTAFDEVFPTDANGNKLPDASGVQIGRLLAASSGYVDEVYEFPVLRSNADVNFKIIFDADATEDPSGTESNVTLYLYDVNWYIDNDVTPSGWQCGIMDEDGNEVGAAAADTLLIPIAA